MFLYFLLYSSVVFSFCVFFMRLLNKNSTMRSSTLWLELLNSTVCRGECRLTIWLTNKYCSGRAQV